MHLGFDGVICDSEPIHADAYREVLERRGFRPGPAFFDALVGLSEPEIWPSLSTAYGIAAEPSELMDERLAVLRPRLLDAPPNWFVRPSLDVLKRLGVRSVIVSAGNGESISMYLERWGLDLAFDAISARGYGYGSKRTRLAEALEAGSGRVLMIEDVEVYLAQAKRTDAVTIGVTHRFTQTLEWSDAVIAAGPEPQMPG